MRGRIRVLAFGTVSGLIWSVIAGSCTTGAFQSVDATATMLLSGILIGVIVSSALAAPLARSGRSGMVCLGLLSLPLGAFLWGVCSALVQWFKGWSYADVKPLESGLACAFMSVMSLLAIVFVPLAILTTYLLWRLVRKHSHQPNSTY